MVEAEVEIAVEVEIVFVVLAVEHVLLVWLELGHPFVRQASYLICL